MCMSTTYTTYISYTYKIYFLFVAHITSTGRRIVSDWLLIKQYFYD